MPTANKRQSPGAAGYTSCPIFKVVFGNSNFKGRLRSAEVPVEGILAQLHPENARRSKGSPHVTLSAFGRLDLESRQSLGVLMHIFLKDSQIYCKIQDFIGIS